jgi:hypothetical protein
MTVRERTDRRREVIDELDEIQICDRDRDSSLTP